MKVKAVESKKEKDDALSVRTAVFVKEQNVPPNIEVDQYEEESIHFVGYKNNIPIAAGRIRFDGEYGKLERISVLKEYRGNSYGRKVIHAMEAEILNQGYVKAKLHSQTHAESFYKQLGYITISDEFMEAGIPHITMVKELKA